MRDRNKSKPRISHQTRIDTLACVLKNSNESSGKTRLIRACNLSSERFDLFKSYLVEAGLLVSASEKGVETFGTTEKGKEFLNDYCRIRSFPE